MQVNRIAFCCASEVEGYLTKMGIWTKEDQVAYNRIQADIRSNEIALRSGGMKLSEARRMALSMSDLRGKLLGLYAKRSQLDGTTVEATAENHKFNFLVTRCVVKENGHPYFADVDEYMARASEEITVLAATALARIVYGYNENFAEKLFESQWLRKYHFMDEQGRLTDREGHLVDRAGRRINEQGRYINEAGELVDREGNRVDANGDLLIEAKPFIDDATGEEVAEKEASKIRPRPGANVLAQRRGDKQWRRRLYSMRPFASKRSRGSTR